MALVDHSVLTPLNGPGNTKGNHIIQGWADAANDAARAALNVLSGDLGRVVKQTDTNKWYLSVTVGTGLDKWQLLGSSDSALTAKGDLATFDTAAARLEVGADGFSPVADSTQSLGLAYVPAGTTSGVLTGCVVTINGGDSALFDVSSGTGIIWDWTGGTPNAPVLVTFAGVTGVTVTDIATTDSTVLFINTSAAVEQFQTGDTTAEQRRELIGIQSLAHPGTTISSVSGSSQPAYEVSQAILDYVRALGPVNSGNLYSAATLLTVAKSAGTTTLPFINRVVDTQNPSVASNATQTPAAILYSFRDGVGGFTFASSTVTDADVGNFDDNSGTPASVSPATRFTIQRCFFFGQTNTQVFTYGQVLYTSIADAEVAIFTENPDVSPALSDATFTTALIVQANTTDLNTAADAKFVAINLGAVSAGGTGTVAGADTQVQFNDSGAHGAAISLTFNKQTISPVLNVIGSATAGFTMTDGTHTMRVQTDGTNPRLRATSDNNLLIENSGAGEIEAQCQFLINHTAADTGSVMNLAATGASGSDIDVHVGVRDPIAIGTISANPGSIYHQRLATGGVSSAFVNVSTTTPGTDWFNLKHAEALTNSAGIVTITGGAPAIGEVLRADSTTEASWQATSTIDTIGTVGTIQSSDGSGAFADITAAARITMGGGGGGSSINIDTTTATGPGSNESAAFSLSTDGGNIVINAPDLISGTPTIDAFTGGSWTNPLTITGPAGQGVTVEQAVFSKLGATDASPILKLSTLGATNGNTVDFLVGTRDPSVTTPISAAAGSLYMRANGNVSGLFMNLGTTTWQDLSKPGPTIGNTDELLMSDGSSGFLDYSADVTMTVTAGANRAGLMISTTATAKDAVVIMTSDIGTLTLTTPEVISENPSIIASNDWTAPLLIQGPDNQFVQVTEQLSVLSPGVTSAGLAIGNVTNGFLTLTYTGTAVPANITTQNGGLALNPDNLELAINNLVNVHESNISFRALASDTSSSGLITFDFSVDQNLQVNALTENITGITLTDPPGPCNISLKITNHASTPFTMTGWPSKVDWVGSSEPVLTATNSAVDVFRFFFDGTRWLGALMKNFG